MPPIMNEFKNGRGHKNKYLDTSRKRLSQEMLTFTIWASPNCNHLKLINVFSLNKDQMSNQTIWFQKNYLIKQI